MTQENKLDHSFKALGDSTRRAIITQMTKAGSKGLSVNQLAQPFLETMSLPAVSKHIRVLEKAGLLRQVREGQVRRCVLEPQTLETLQDWITWHHHFWNSQLDQLTDFLESPSQTDEQNT